MNVTVVSVIESILGRGGVARNVAPAESSVASIPLVRFMVVVVVSPVHVSLLAVWFAVTAAIVF